MGSRKRKYRYLTALSTIVLFAISVLGCGRQAVDEKYIVNPPLKAGEVVDLKAEYFRKWPGRSAIFKINKDLVLAIPPQFQAFWLQYDAFGRDQMTRMPVKIDELPDVTTAFRFFMPDFGGYTQENYLNDDFNEDAIEVINVSSAPMSSGDVGAPGYLAQNQFSRLLKAGIISSEDDYVERFDLRCYRNQSSQREKEFCFGTTDPASGEKIIIDVSVPPHPRWVVFPMMQARYFSRRYGGVDIVWRAHAKNLKDWLAIEKQIWKYLDMWNIAKSDASDS